MRLYVLETDTSIGTYIYIVCVRGRHVCRKHILGVCLKIAQLIN